MKKIIVINILPFDVELSVFYNIQKDDYKKIGNISTDLEAWRTTNDSLNLMHVEGIIYDGMVFNRNNTIVMDIVHDFTDKHYLERVLVHESSHVVDILFDILNIDKECSKIKRELRAHITEKVYSTVLHHLEVIKIKPYEIFPTKIVHSYN